MLQNLTGWHALIILAIVVLIFGAAKLPALAKSVGQSLRILRSESAEHGDSAPGTEAGTAPGASASVPMVADAPRPVLKVAE
jgi:sec-independent protein translocase protein TatA